MKTAEMYQRRMKRRKYRQYSRVNQWCVMNGNFVISVTKTRESAEQRRCVQLALRRFGDDTAPRVMHSIVSPGGWHELGNCEGCK